MANPKLYLPPNLSEDLIRKLLADLRLPEPTTVKPLITTAAYHNIYLISFPGESALSLGQAQPNEPDGSISLVLRVSGKHLPRIKTLNEVAAMTWVRDATKIPVPAIVCFDASQDNAIGHEYILLEKAPGVSVDTIYDSLDDEKREYLIIQLMNYLMELRQCEWHHSGGLSMNENGKIVPGRVLAENFWQAPEIGEFWGSEETIDTLNVTGPFDTYTDYVEGHIQQYTLNIEKHASLEWMRDIIPRLQAFVAFLKCNATNLNDTKYILSQRDLHFGNIMCDSVTLQITAVLDWEFSAVLPLPIWTPGGGFLWNAQEGPEALAERDRLYQIFTKLCKSLDCDLVADFDIKNQKPYLEISRVLNYVRAIVEVCPRGQKSDSVRSWRTAAEEALTELGA
ncbi:kinase-like domain-containing protein [Truncatella angustata]|uniref:Kinase-like domain-containing protein n=1 Tax=Truncatella angustata TaxID=152316 RepID=A0A9P8UU38_9PEZI|nr:kinase-like domain-containing protein [Truncatella angustata]KAH6658102.1 kinase-like domain-containing protein [Truncatella angustata]